VTSEPTTRWEGQLPGDLRFVFHRLASNGIPAFVVGPAVRDAWLNNDVSRMQRIDLIAEAPSAADLERILDGASTQNIFVARTERIRRNAVIFTLQESKQGENLRRLVFNTIETVADLKDELAKREVTVNAMAMTPEGEIIDPFNGLADLENRLIHPVIKPSVAFVQKPLFLIKIAKHIAYHGFAPSDDTEKMAKRHSLSILDVPMERIRPELERLLVNRHPELGLHFLEYIGVLKYILPELQGLVGFADSCEVHHKDIWDHTLRVVAQSKPNVAIRWAALLHDIGKAWTRSIDAQGRVHFFRHEDLSASLFKGIAARIGLEERLSERIHFLIQNHSRINNYSRDWTDSAVRRLARNLHPHLEDLMLLSRADITSRQERRVEELTAGLDDLEARIVKFAQEEARQPLLPKGAGKIIMDHFGLPPSPLVGRLKEALEEALKEGRLPPDLPVENYLGFLQEYIRQQGKQSG
jgi:poly(A) polymerase